MKPYIIGWNRAISFLMADSENRKADFGEEAVKRCDDIRVKDRGEAIEGFIAYCESHKEEAWH